MSSGAAGMAGRRLRGQLVQRVAHHLHTRGAGGPGTDHVDPDTLGPELRSPALRHEGQRRLAPPVRSHARDPELGGHGGDVDDGAPATLGHPGRDVADQVERRLHVGAEGGVEHVFPEARGGAEGTAARVVDQDVDPPPGRLGGAAAQVPRGRRVVQVGLHEVGLAAVRPDLVHDRRAAAGVPARHEHVGPPLGQRDRGGLPDPAGGAGDQRGPPAQILPGPVAGRLGLSSHDACLQSALFGSCDPLTRTLVTIFWIVHSKNWGAPTAHPDWGAFCAAGGAKGTPMTEKRPGAGRRGAGRRLVRMRRGLAGS